MEYYIVDVFTSEKYGGNQLGVFIDFDQRASSETMLTIAKELGFAEISFVTKKHDNPSFDVRIFTPEYEVPFAGHPTLGTSYIISKHLVSTPTNTLHINLKHASIKVELSNTEDLSNSYFTMEQATPEFIDLFTAEEIASALDIPLEWIDPSLPVEEITTGLPYIIIPLRSLHAINNLVLDDKKLLHFLTQNEKYKSNSRSGLSTSLFFITPETVHANNGYHSRMFCIENEKITEDAATGSANGCFLAYLLKHKNKHIQTTVEQGFALQRKSYIKLEGELNNNTYKIKVGGQVVEVSRGIWQL